MEKFEDQPKDAAQRKKKIKELDYLLLDVEKKLDALKASAGRSSGRGGLRDMSPLGQAERDFFRIERILEWHQFGTYDRLIAHHQHLLQRLNSMGASSGAGGARN